MGDWQPIETAPTGVPVQLGGWGPDYISLRAFERVEKLVWSEWPGIAYALNERAIRVRKCDSWVRWWKPIDLSPPVQP